MSTITGLYFSSGFLSDLGRQKVMEIKPIARSIPLKEELYQVNEYLGSLENENRIPDHYFDEITKEIHLLGIEDSFLEGKSFQKIASISMNVNEVLKFFKKFLKCSKISQNLVLKMFLLLKYQKLLTFFVKNPKKTFHVLLGAFIWNHPSSFRYLQGKVLGHC